MRTILRTTEVRCPFTAAMAFAERCCERVTARRIATKTVRDRTDRARRNTALTVEFVPLTRLPYPAFRLRVAARPWHGGCKLHIEASYETPLGIIGRAGDALVFRRLAARTVARFVDELVSAIEDAWKREREGWTPPLEEPARASVTLTLA